MAFKEATSWQERGRQLDALKAKSNEIIKRLNLPETDARVRGMVHVRQLANTLAAVPIMLQLKAENAPTQVCSVLGISGLDDLSSLLGDLNHNSKCAFVTMAQFALENSVALTLKAMPVSGSNKFYKRVESLLNVAGYSTSGHEFNVLMVPQSIRNSLHANGIHCGAAKSANIGGAQYTFVPGQRVNCASWSHIFHALSACLDIYSQIFSSSQISAIACIPAP